MSAAVQTALDPVTLLAELLRTPSVTGSTAVAAARLVETTRAAGFESHVDSAGSVVMRWGGGAATSDILLLGHLDTVPGDIPVRLQEGRMHGRGSVDAKGPLAAALAAVSALPVNGAPVTVVAVCDEEGPSLGARLLRARVAPSALVVLEPSGFNTITTGYRGCLRLRAAIERPCAHHAAPEPAAADLLVAALATLQERLGSRGGACARDGGRAVDAVQLRINALHTAQSEQTEVAEAAVEIRVPVGTSVDAVLSTVTEALGEASIAVDSACEAVRVPRGNAVVRGLARAVAAEGGGRATRPRPGPATSTWSGRPGDATPRCTGPATAASTTPRASRSPPTS